jgi:putative membrane protein
MATVDRLFSEDDRQRISAAVREAEGATSGEIVVVVAAASDDHPEARWRSAIALAGLVLLADLAYRHLARFWLPWTADAASLALVGAGVLGFFAASFAPLRRTLVGRERMRLRVRRAAEAAFAAERVFETRDRTGILIFLSLLEHEVVVLPDTGIAAKAPEAAWAGVVEGVVRGMKAGRPADALVGAVRSCGAALRAAGFHARPDDANELGDDVRSRR